MRPRTAARTAALLASAALSLATLSGCNWGAWGMASSDGRFNYTSTIHTPYTVTLVDTSTGDVLWTYEVPVGKTISIRFLEGHDAEATGKDTMKWDVFPAKRIGSTLANSMPVPAASSRILKVYLREGPEAFPESTTAAATPAPAAPIQPAPAAAPTPESTPAPEATPAPAAAPSTIILPDPKQPAPSAPAPAKPDPSKPAPSKPAKEPKAPPVDLPQ